MPRRTRFPAYAPEGLEARLSPSGELTILAWEALPIGAVVVAGDVSPVPVTLATDTPAPVAPTPDTPVRPRGGTDPGPPSGPGDPPIDEPTSPIGPAGPA